MQFTIREAANWKLVIENNPRVLPLQQLPTRNC